MELLRYQLLKTYLIEHILPCILTPQEWQSIQAQSQFFEVKNGLIYKKDKYKINYLLKVIQRYEVEPILFLIHTHLLGEHFGIDIMFNKIHNRYYWSQIYTDIWRFVCTCDACQRRKKNLAKPSLHPIPVEAPFFKIGIDIIGPLPKTPCGNCYIVVATDYITKWPKAKAIKNANTQEVADFIYEDIVYHHDCSQYLLSDRGTHFHNNLIDEFLKKFAINHHYSTPFNTFCISNS